MEIALRFISLIVIGALIGGITNFFAVKMLFRPLHPVYIGKWRLPFTPGLIPKRHHDIAQKLGQVVVEHLLTSDRITEKLYEQKFLDELTDQAKKEVSRFLNRDDTLLELTRSWNLEDADEKVERMILEKFENKVWELVEDAKDKSIANIFPHELNDYIEQQIPNIVDMICSRTSVYFASDEGKERVGELIERFLDERGKLGNMLKMFLGNESVVNRIQPEIVKLFHQTTTRELLEQILMKEWLNLKQKAVREFDDSLNYSRIIHFLKAEVAQQAQIKEWFQRPIYEIVEHQKEAILEKFVPQLVIAFRDFAVTKVDVFIEKMQLSEMVKTQVESFPLQRVEEIVLTISSREFKMITYLGALLGGMIGAMQGVMFLFL